MSADHRLAVPLSKAYRLLNHGPTVLVSAAHDGQRNIMAAAWAMPLDFDPPKIAVVIDIAEYRRLKGETAEFKDYLRSGPGFDALDLDRAAERPPDIDWASEA